MWSRRDPTAAAHRGSVSPCHPRPPVACSGIRNDLRVNRKYKSKQECIPVGCVPAASNVSVEVSALGRGVVDTPQGRQPLGRHPPGQTPPDRHPLWAETPLGRHPRPIAYWDTHPATNYILGYTPSPPPDRQMPVKILHCPKLRLPAVINVKQNPKGLNKLVIFLKLSWVNEKIDGDIFVTYFYWSSPTTGTAIL